MKKYGKISLIAIAGLTNGSESDPRDAWQKAALEIFPESDSLRNKGCPMDTFLGLCEEGLIRGVNPGTYTRSVKNKGYALQAVSILKSNSKLARDEKLLWEMVMGGMQKQENSQMDVVTTLWLENLVNQENS